MKSAVDREIEKLTDIIADCGFSIANVGYHRMHLDKAVRFSDLAIRALPPGHHAVANIQVQKSYCETLRGDFNRGLETFRKWRPTIHPGPSITGVPLWDGEPLDANQSLLVLEDQGLGDHIIYSRYLETVTGRCKGPVYMRCKRETWALFKRCFPRVVCFQGLQCPMPTFTVAITDLPRICLASPSNITGRPYLTPSTDVMERLKGVIGGPVGNFRVGIAWAGAIENCRNMTRTVSLRTRFALLFEWDNVTVVSLQVGPPEIELKKFPRPFRAHLSDPTPHMVTLEETAAIIAQLDLVVTSDTCVLHVAGSMGIPTWTFLPHSPGTYWFFPPDGNPERCLWYDSVRLFRMDEPDRWDRVFRRIWKTEFPAWVRANKPRFSSTPGTGTGGAVPGPEPSTTTQTGSR